MAGRLKYSRCSSDTYDIYYDNPGLIPKIHWPPMEMGDSTPRTLDKDRGDATVDDICDFIVEYINSDVMVRLRLFAVPVSFSLVHPVKQGLLSDRHIIIADQSKVGPLFVYDLPGPHLSIGWRIRRSLHEACQAL
jgi:RNA-dependent RNA polymerase